MLDLELLYRNAVPETGNEVVPCALKMKCSNEEQRIPMHFVLLLDTSDSMNENAKLENVKQCIRLLMNVLGPTDYISLITFASESKIWLRRVSADASQRGMIEETIQKIHTDGMTNLSAGLGEITRVIEGETIKTGLVLLTDGHANKGVHSVSELRRILNQIRESNPLLSFSSIAYGTDHNAELLKTLCEDANGAYCIVNSLEDTAIAIGDSLGGLMSCAYQNTEFLLPSGTVVEGPYRTLLTEKGVSLKLGDIYSGTDNLLLFSIPANFIRDQKPIVECKAISLPAFTSVNYKIESGTALLARDKDIELTSLRFECASLWRRVRKNKNESTLRTDIDKFKEKLEDTFFDGHPVLAMLKEEASSLANAYQAVLHPFAHENEMTSFLAQHETYVGLGRGATTSLGAPPQTNNRPLRRHQTSFIPSEGSDPVGPAQTITSPYQNHHQRRITSLMQTLSQGSE